MTEEQNDRTIPAGSLICFSTGEYSDYGYRGHFVTLMNLTPEAVSDARDAANEAFNKNDAEQDAWKRESGTPYPASISRQEAFIAALIRAGFLMALTVRELHLGSYGDLDVYL